MKKITKNSFFLSRLSSIKVQGQNIKNLTLLFFFISFTAPNPNFNLFK